MRVPVETMGDAEERRQAVKALMLLPDPPDIRGRRRYRWKFGGDKPFLKAELEAAYLQHRIIDSRPINSCIISVRRG